MKPVGSFSRLVFCGVALSALLTALSAQAADGKAVVRDVRGTAEYADKGGQFQTLTQGKVLAPGAIVRSGVGSEVDLDLGNNGPTVRLLADTTLGLERLSMDRTGLDVVIETMLDLQKGTIKGFVKKLSPASRYEVKTPRTVAAIKATDNDAEYQISADGVHHVLEGSTVVAFTRNDNSVVTSNVNEGQTFVPPTDATPTAVPVVRPTGPEVVPLPPDVRGPVVAPVAPVVTVPAPIQFVSPTTGAAGGN